MSLAFIIITYNGSNYIRNCLKGIYNIPSSRIYVVDNMSTDDTVSIIREEFAAVHITSAEENLGFGRANNLAIKTALNDINPDHLLLINQDAYIDQENVNQLLKASLSNPEYGIISPVHLDGSGKILDRGFSDHVSLNPDKLFSESHDLHPVEFVNAAAWLVKNELFQEVGGFDPIFHHYGEDDNLVNRMRFCKKKIGVVGGTFIKHDRDQSLKDSGFKKKAEWRNYLVRATDPGTEFNGELNRTIRRWIRMGSLLLILKAILNIPLISRHRKLTMSPSKPYLYILDN